MNDIITDPDVSDAQPAGGVLTGLGALLGGISTAFGTAYSAVNPIATVQTPTGQVAINRNTGAQIALPGQISSTNMTVLLVIGAAVVLVLILKK